MSDLVFRDGEWVPVDLPEVPGPDVDGAVVVKKESPDLIHYNGEWVPADIDFSAVEMFKNLPGSAGNLLTETWEGIKGIPEIASLVYENPSVLKEIPSAVWDDLTDQYGGVERFQRTLQENPVQVLADALGAVGGAAVATKLGGKLLKKGGEALYGPSSKFSTTLPIDEKKALVRSAMDLGVSTTEGGASKLATRIKKLNTGIEELLDNANPDDIIPIDSVISRLKKTRAELGGLNNLDAPKDLAIINKLEEGFREHAWELGRDNFTVKELQKFKKNLYKTIKFDARKQKGTMAAEKARKEVGRGAKEALQDAVPGIAEKNRELSDLYELQPHVERAASRIHNLNPLSLTGAGLGGLAGGFGGVGAGMGGAGSTMSSLLGALAMSSLLSPSVLQGTGRGAYKLGKAFDKIPAKSGLATPFAMPGRTREEDR